MPEESRERSGLGSPAYETRRQEIANAAAKLFVASGVAFVSVDDIARSAGLAKPSLYHYFKTKDEILYAIHQEAYTALISSAERLKDAPVDQRLFGAFLESFRMVHARPGYSRVVFEHVRHLAEPYRGMVRKNQAHYESEVRKIVADGMADGLLAPGDVGLTTIGLFGLVNWSHQWYSPAGRHTPEELARYFYRLFTLGIYADRARNRPLP